MPETQDEVQISEELQQSLKDICKTCEDEDKEIFKAMKRQWKKAEEFWHGVQFLFWSDSQDGWKSASAGVDDELNDEESGELGSFSDKVVDIYKAHGESIIAALAAQIPALRFLPDDADATADTLTARTYSTISDLIQRHNKAKLIFLRALFYLANMGVVASYRYKESDVAYGTHKVTTFSTEKVEQVTYTCKECGYEADKNWLVPDAGNSPDQQQPFQYDPSSANEMASAVCPQCGSPDKPKEIKEKIDVPKVASEEERPKTRVKLDVFGPLHWKTNLYARNQKETTFFGLLLDQGKDVIAEQFPDLADKIFEDRLDNTDRFARAIYNYPTDEEIEKINLCTIARWWLRPAAFYRERSESKRKALLKEFPEGCKVTLVGREKHFAKVENDKYDDRWEIGQAGLSTYLYSDAILRPLIEIQEMRNDLVNLIIETIKHGIPSMFADPKVLNFDTYGQFEATPGFVYQVKAARPGEAIGNSFYTSDRATLSREVALFLKQLDQDAQFAIGSFPSIYGGPSEGKSRTFAEYAASRQMALQRLSIVWNLVVDWWVRTLSGCVTMYVSTVVEDEKFSQFKDGNYINVWIKRSQMEGKIGGVEPEASEGFPMSLAQKKDLVMKLMEMNNEYVNNALYKPENAKIIQDVLALTEMKLPGESQRVKQVMEINQMVRDGAPADEMTPTVPIDPNVDDDAVHIETLIAFMVDQPGLDLLRDAPEAYQNLTAHLKMHQMNLAMKTMQQAGNTPPGQAPETAHAGVE